MARTDRKIDFAKSIVRFAQQHNKWTTMSKEEAALETVMVILDDIGAAQEFLNAIGVTVDLYESTPNDPKQKGR